MKKRNKEEDIVNIPVKRHSSDPEIYKNLDKHFIEIVNSTKSKKAHINIKKYFLVSVSAPLCLSKYLLEFTSNASKKADFSLLSNIDFFCIKNNIKPAKNSPININKVFINEPS